MHVVLAAGGTAGHIYPALNTARAIRSVDPTVRCTILGTDRGLDRELIPGSGFELVTIPAVPFPRKPNLAALRFPIQMSKSVRAAKLFFRSQSVDVVVGFGGYASAPAYLAARSLKIPIIVHEANSTAGLANRLGARFTSEVALNYPDVIPGGKVIGMPLSQQISDLNRSQLRGAAREHFDLPPTGPVLLIFGGSQGAHAINAAVTQAAPELLARGISILHAVGINNELPKIPDSDGPAVYRPLPYIASMELAYSAADFSINRAGAMTVAEIAAVGMPSAFIPLPIGNGEQERNAQALIEHGAAIMCSNQNFNSNWIVSNIAELMVSPSRLESMSESTRVFGHRGAAAELARWALAFDSPQKGPISQ